MYDNLLNTWKNLWCMLYQPSTNISHWVDTCVIISGRCNAKWANIQLYHGVNE